MGRRRVVVTGLGVVTPVGNSVDECWRAVLAGSSGIGPIDHFDVSDFTTRIGGSVRDFDPANYFAAKDARKMDVFIQYGLAAAIQAIADAGLEATDATAPRIGAAIGSGIGGITSIERGYDIIQRSGPRKMSPFFVPSSIINMIAGHVSMRYNFQGPNLALTTACTTGTHAIGIGARLIQCGDVDAMVVGGAEMATSPVGLGGFAAARALSTRNDDPAAASRPWDRDRDGFVLGDGAGVLVIEEYQFARRRGARIYAELTGFGMSADAYHITSPPDDGRGAALAMDNALADAAIDPADIDYINAHGTSTLQGDLVETVAIKRSFGEHAHRLAISSTKSMIGHLLGAAGAVEAVATVLALRDQVAPPTINLDRPGDGCDLDYVPHNAREMTIRAALTNSFGFGGTNGSLIFQRLAG